MSYYMRRMRQARKAHLLGSVTTININSDQPPPSAPLLKIPKKKDIKKKLKIIVELSNDLQDENNVLKDMKDAWVPFKDIYNQRLKIGELHIKQHKAIEELNYIESFFPDEKKNRFFFFREVKISFP